MEEKLNKQDEGPLVFEVFIKEGHVILDWGKPVSWLGLHKEDAENLGRSLLEKAKKLK